MEYGKMNEKEKQMLVNEVNILREMKHPNIVRYYDRIIDRETTKIYIVMEFCEGGDVAGLIKKYRRERCVLALVGSRVTGIHGTI
jgi:serine/threonine-protein kinase Nek2